MEINTEGVGCLFSCSNHGESISDSRRYPSPSRSTTSAYIPPETRPIAACQIAITVARTNTRRRGLAFAVGYALFIRGILHSFSFLTQTMRSTVPTPPSLTPQTIFDDRRVLNLFQEQCDNCKEASYDRGRRR